MAHCKSCSPPIPRPTKAVITCRRVSVALAEKPLRHSKYCFLRASSPRSPLLPGAVTVIGLCSFIGDQRQAFPGAVQRRSVILRGHLLSLADILELFQARGGFEGAVTANPTCF